MPERPPDRVRGSGMRTAGDSRIRGAVFAGAALLAMVTVAACGSGDGQHQPADAALHHHDHGRLDDHDRGHDHHHGGQHHHEREPQHLRRGELDHQHHLGRVDHDHRPPTTTTAAPTTTTTQAGDHHDHPGDDHHDREGHDDHDGRHLHHADHDRRRPRLQQRHVAVAVGRGRRPARDRRHRRPARRPASPATPPRPAGCGAPVTSPPAPAPWPAASTRPPPCWPARSR